MKLHKDGTIEGTPQELAEYSRLIAEKKEPFKVIPPSGINPNENKTNITSGAVDARYPGSGVIYVGTVQPKVSMRDYPTNRVEVMTVEDVRREVEERYSSYMEHLIKNKLFH